MADKAFCILSLGSNMGDRKKTLDDAIEVIRSNEAVSDLKCASFYETEPVGYLDQPWFLNTCVSIETTMEPLELLDYVQGIEQDFHRERTIRWGPRTLDIDIITYGDITMNTKRLSCDTYCAREGECLALGRDASYMCDGCMSPQRICCNYVITAFQRDKERIKVIIVGEELGF